MTFPDTTATDQPVHTAREVFQLLGRPAAVARMLGITKQTLHPFLDKDIRLLTGLRLVQLAPSIEARTTGNPKWLHEPLTRRWLRPDDFHLIWPELQLVAANDPAPAG